MFVFGGNVLGPYVLESQGDSLLGWGLFRSYVKLGYFDVCVWFYDSEKLTFKGKLIVH
jgi:hypothetical protein